MFKIAPRSLREGLPLAATLALGTAIFLLNSGCRTPLGTSEPAGPPAPIVPAPLPQAERERILEPTRQAKPLYHEVRQGETAHAIAHRYKIHPAALIRANHLGDGHHIEIGQRLLIPRWESAAPVHVTEQRRTPRQEP